MPNVMGKEAAETKESTNHTHIHIQNIFNQIFLLNEFLPNV